MDETKFRAFLARLVAGCMAACAISAAFAQSFPAKPVP